MSKENVEMLRRAYAAFERDGVEGIMPFLDEGIEWKNPQDSPIAGVWHGHDGVRGWFAQALDAFGEMSFSPDEFREVSEHRVLVLLRFELKGTASALHMEVPFAHVIDLDHGRVTALKMYSDQQEALETVGLPE